MSKRASEDGVIEAHILTHPDIENWPEPDTDIELGRCLGDGAYGKVYRGVLKQSRQAVAVKVVTIDPMDEPEIGQEVAVLERYEYAPLAAPACAHTVSTRSARGQHTVSTLPSRLSRNPRAHASSTCNHRRAGTRGTSTSAVSTAPTASAAHTGTFLPRKDP